MAARLGWGPQEALCGGSGRSPGMGSSPMFPGLGLSHVPRAGRSAKEANVKTAAWRPGPVAAPRVGAGGTALPSPRGQSLAGRRACLCHGVGPGVPDVGEIQVLPDGSPWSSLLCVPRSQVLALWLPSHRGLALPGVLCGVARARGRVGTLTPGPREPVKL